MNVVLDDAEEVWVKVSKKADGEASSNGKVKREYGDRKALGQQVQLLESNGTG